MNFKARTLAALALAALASTLSAPAALAAGHHHHHHAADRASYPMKADEFRKLMEKRIDSVRAAIDRKLDRRGVSPERKKAIHKIFDEASGEVRAEIARTSAGGTVTHSDAEKVKTLASGLRTRVRERLRAERDPKFRAKLAQREAKRKEHAAHETALEAARKKEAQEAARKKEAQASREAAHPAGRSRAASDEPKGAKATARSEGAAKKATKAHAAHATHAGHDKGPSGPTRTAKVVTRTKLAPPKEDPGSNL